MVIPGPTIQFPEDAPRRSTTCFIWELLHKQTDGEQMKGRRAVSREDLSGIVKRFIMESNLRIGAMRLQLLRDDPSAPICLHCVHCVQETGALFHCTRFESPEDGRVVGEVGNVYFRRGETRKVFPNVPLSTDGCGMYEPMTPVKIRVD